MWLPRDDVERLRRLAAADGLDVPKLIEQVLRPTLDADEGDVALTFVFDRDRYEAIRARVAAHLAAIGGDRDVDETIGLQVADTIAFALEEGRL